MPYFSLHMAFYGIFDSECRESEVQITSTPRSKHLASMFAYKKFGLKKPGNGWLNSDKELIYLSTVS